MKGQSTRIKISKLLGIACLASLCLGGAVACTKRATENCVLTSEDYAVYSSVFLDMNKGGNSTNKTELIISDLTVSGDDDFLASQKVQRLVKEASDDTVANFNARRKSTCHLKPQLSGAISYRVVSQEDLAKAFTKDRGGWESFYKEYPRTTGIVHLSAVGYNTGETEALVYVDNNCGGLCGGGYLVFLANQNGHWEVKHHSQVWLS
jgi:hypothetical protein